MKQDKNMKTEYNTQRTSGLWLVYIGVIIILSAITGADLYIQPFIFGFGYLVGFILILGLPYVNRKLAYGKNSKFQERMENVSVVLNVVLCTLCGIFIGVSDLRLLWLVIFIIVGIHFFGFYFSQGKLMLMLGGLTIINSLIGILLFYVPFILFAVIDGIIKLTIGFKMLLMRRMV